MSVDDRLRAGLEANAVDFLPEGEARLAQVHTRLRRRGAFQGSAVVASVAAAVAVIAVVEQLSSGCGPGGARAPAHSHRDDLGVRTVRVSRTPAGAGCSREPTPSAPASEADIVRYLGADARLPLTFQFETDAWSLLVTNDEGVAEVGDFGPFVYNAPGRLTMTSNGAGVPRVRVRPDLADPRQSPDSRPRTRREPATRGRVPHAWQLASFRLMSTG